MKRNYRPEQSGSFEMEWINVKDRPIEGDEFFIANFRDKPPFIALAWRYTVHNPTGEFFKYTGGSLIHMNNITHWMPLPPRPKYEELKL
jgi:hypothetical protein